MRGGGRARVCTRDGEGGGGRGRERESSRMRERKRVNEKALMRASQTERLSTRVRA